jgi:hypothetical protein
VQEEFNCYYLINKDFYSHSDRQIIITQRLSQPILSIKLPVTYALVLLYGSI